MADKTERLGPRQDLPQKASERPAPAYLTPFQVIAYFAAIGVGASTFFGLRDYFQGTGISGWVLAIVFSVVLTAALAAVWHFLLKFASEI